MRLKIIFDFLNNLNSPETEGNKNRNNKKKRKYSAQSRFPPLSVQLATSGSLSGAPTVSAASSPELVCSPAPWLPAPP